MKKIFDKYFPLFNWQLYKDGLLVTNKDPREFIKEDMISFFVENQGKDSITYIEFQNREKGYRITANKSHFYNKMLKDLK